MGTKSKYKFRKAYVKTIDDYLDSVKDDKNHLPKVQSYALSMGVSMEVIKRWEKESDSFRLKLDKIKLIQLVKLVDDSLYKGKILNQSVVTKLLDSWHEMGKEIQNEVKMPTPMLQVLQIKTNTLNQNISSGNIKHVKSKGVHPHKEDGGLE